MPPRAIEESTKECHRLIVWVLGGHSEASRFEVGRCRPQALRGTINCAHTLWSIDASAGTGEAVPSSQRQRSAARGFQRACGSAVLGIVNCRSP